MIRYLLLFAVLTTPVYAKALRIVSTAPSITQSLFALGLGNQVVGVTNYCDYPAEAKEITKIGTFLKPDVETIVGLHPDLVIVQRMPNQLAEQLSRLKIRSVEVNHSTVQDVFVSNEAIASAAGVPQAATKLNSELQQGITQIRQRTGNLKKPKAVFIIEHSMASFTSLIVAGANTYFSEILNMAGASNAFDDGKSPYSRVSLEEVLRHNPDVIFELSEQMSSAKDASIVQRWKNESSVAAVKSNRVYIAPSPIFVVPGPRVVEAVRYLAHLLHPEAGL